MDKAGATEAMIPNVRLKYQTYDVIYNKTKHRSLTNAKFCFSSSKLSLFLLMVYPTKMKDVSSGTKHMFCI